MNDVKTPFTRLLRLTRAARDAWKGKAQERQKRLRAAQVRIRDLEQSRSYWKMRALAAEGGASARAAAGGENSDEEPPPWRRRWRRGSPTTAIAWR
jgi:hypothetical protein